nr:GTPase HflX [Maliibacterium massiliense]
MVSGNIEGLKKHVIAQLEALYDLEIGRGCFASAALLDAMADITAQCGREVAVYIARDGEILEVYVGTNDRVSLSERRLRRGADGLSGVRCIHTHPSGSSELSLQDEQTLHQLLLDAMAAVSVRQGRAASVRAGLLDEGGAVRVLGPEPPYRVEKGTWMQEIRASEQIVRRELARQQVQTQERAFLVGMRTEAGGDVEASLEELARLADTAGALVCGRMIQRRPKPDNAFFIGRGKLEELAVQSRAAQADIIIFDEELSGIQLRNLEDALGARVIDRTALILDIFAMRAQTREGKLQVELAQQAYRLPRLLGMGTVLSRLGGGIGTRGPGEKKLEVNRRYIRRRIADLEQELALMQRQRDVRRARREQREVPVVALVGYTNAGKSTLLNRLSGSEVLAEDKLFATLDAVSRRVALPGGQEVLFVDTVGFIDKLPHDLVRAFRATLEEAAYADVLVHVIDASSARWPQQKQVVEQVLQELGAQDKPVILAFNKMDAVPAGEMDYLHEKGCLLAARTGAGVDALLRAVGALTQKCSRVVDVALGYDQGALRTRLHEAGQVLQETFEDDGVHMRVRLDEVAIARLRATGLEL